MAEEIVTEGTDEGPSENEKEASAQGWVPKEKFRGDEKDWIDADTFVQRGREINPILRKHNAELKRELAQAKATAQEAVEAARDFRTFQKEQFEKKKIEYEAQIINLRAAKKQAITDGDGDRAVEIDEAIDLVKEEKGNLKAPTVAAAPDVSAKIDPDLADWLDTNNTWYGKDSEESIERTELTNGMAMAIRRKHPSLVGKAFLTALDAAIDEKFSDWRGTKRSKPLSPAEGSSNGTARPSGQRGKGYSDLPADAKAACDKFVKQKLMTREQYLSDYFE